MAELTWKAQDWNERLSVNKLQSLADNTTEMLANSASSILVIVTCRRERQDNMQIALSEDYDHC